jgi:hypothetical protein
MRFGDPLATVLLVSVSAGAGLAATGRTKKRAIEVR